MSIINITEGEGEESCLRWGCLFADIGDGWPCSVFFFPCSVGNGRRCSVSTINISWYSISASQTSATHCNTLQHTATPCNALQRTTTQCNALQRTATHCNALQRTAAHCNALQRTATHCTALHRTTPHYTTLHRTTPHCNTHVATWHAVSMCQVRVRVRTSHVSGDGVFLKKKFS